MKSILLVLTVNALVVSFLAEGSGSHHKTHHHHHNHTKVESKHTQAQKIHLVEPTEFAPIVQTNLGKIRGVVREVEDYEPVHFYEGIRYGRAERFKKPRPVESWEGIYNATGFRFACPQPAILPGDKVTGSYTAETSNEDCLYLNIWKPSKESTTNRAVMVWFHSGGFNLGQIFSQTYDGRFLAAVGDVIVVSISYRLGAFGFLYSGTSDAIGNQGLHDQILALKFINQNIHFFGGDPTRVTLFGQSSGAMSIGALVLSPIAKNLFKRAILQSGVPNSYLGSHDKAKGFKQTKSLASFLKCSTDSGEEIVACLKEKTVLEILMAEMKTSSLMNPIYGDELLPHRPVEALKYGKFNRDIDIMYGVTKDEGSAFVGPLISMLKNDKTNDNLSLQETKNIIKSLMAMLGTEVLGEVIDFYTKNLDETNQTAFRNAIGSAFGDFHLTCPTILYGEEYSKHEYQRHFYSYRLMQPLTNPIGYGCERSYGVCHAMDIAYIFGLPMRLRGIGFTEEEYTLSKDMITAWTQFAKHGNPGTIGGVEWKESLVFDGSSYTTRHMELYAGEYKLNVGFWKENCNVFWKPKIFE